MADLPVAQATSEVDPTSDLGHMMFDDSAVAVQQWIEHFLTVPNELGRIVPMQLFPQQTKMLQDETGRDIIVKGRQTRASSLIMARNVRMMTMGQVWGATCVVGAQDDATTALFRHRIRHHILNDLANKGFKFELGKDSADELIIKDLDNRFLFVSGEQKTLGRGYAAQSVHFSEFAHWKDSALELLGGMLPAVPAYPYGRVVLESTPKGEQGAFYEYASTAKPLNPSGQWTVHLYPWWLEPRYRVHDNPQSGCDIILGANDLYERRVDFQPTDYETKLMMEHGLKDIQIIWRRMKKVEQDKTQAPFLQEYPEDLDTCWLGVQGKFFDTPDGVDHLEFYREARRTPVKMFESLPYKGDTVSFYGANLAIWEFPDHNDTYVMGFDTAGGGIGKDSDWSVAYVMSVKKEKIVARLRVQVSPKVFASMIAAIATFYKEATINGERTHQGDMVFTELRDLMYSKLYYHVDPMKPLGKTERPGVGTFPSPQLRQAVLEKFKTAVTNHALESFCSELVREMNVFTWQKFQGRMKVAAMDLVGQHDDCIFAAAYAWWIIDKARDRLKANRRDDPSEFIVTGLNNMVRRPTDERGHQVWFGV